MKRWNASWSLTPQAETTTEHPAWLGQSESGETQLKGEPRGLYFLFRLHWVFTVALFAVACSISRCRVQALGCAGLVALWHGDLSPPTKVKPTSPALEHSFLTRLTPPEKAPEVTFEPQISLSPSPCAK